LVDVAVDDFPITLNRVAAGRRSEHCKARAVAAGGGQGRSAAQKIFRCRAADDQLSEGGGGAGDRRCDCGRGGGAGQVDGGQINRNASRDVAEDGPETGTEVCQTGDGALGSGERRGGRVTLEGHGSAVEDKAGFGTGVRRRTGHILDGAAGVGAAVAACARQDTSLERGAEVRRIPQDSYGRLRAAIGVIGALVKLLAAGAQAARVAGVAQAGGETGANVANHQLGVHDRHIAGTVDRNKCRNVTGGGGASRDRLGIGAHVGNAVNARHAVAGRGQDRHTVEGDRLAVNAAHYALVNIRRGNGAARQGHHGTIGACISRATRLRSGAENERKRRTRACKAGVRFVDHQHRFRSLTSAVAQQAAGNRGVQEHRDVGLGNLSTRRQRGAACAIQHDIASQLRNAFGTDCRGYCGGISCAAKRIVVQATSR